MSIPELASDKDPTVPMQNRAKIPRRDPKIHVGGDPQVKLTAPRTNAASSSKTGNKPDTSGWLTRTQSADMLKMSVSTIANYERRGKLHPQFVYRPDLRGIEHRVAVYDPDELTKLPRPHPFLVPTVREPGEVAARSFELFDKGMNIREVVIELRETPEKVRALHEAWLDAGGADLTISEAAKAAFEKLLGPFSDVVDLLNLVEGLSKRLESKA